MSGDFDKVDWGFSALNVTEALRVQVSRLETKVAALERKLEALVASVHLLAKPDDPP
jgi:hypothetical protein